MKWVGLIAGLLLAWLIGALLDGESGALLVLGAVGGALYAGLRKRVANQEARAVELTAQVARLEAALQRRSLAVDTAAGGADADGVEATAPVSPGEEGTPAQPAVVQDGTGGGGPAVTPPSSTPSSTLSPTPALARTAADEDALWDPVDPRQAAPNAGAAAAAPADAGDERSPAVTTSLGATLAAWVRGGNTIVRAAVLILFIGVAFLLRYVAERATVPLELRLGLVAAGGVALAVLGLRLARRRRGYALTLQGAGIGIVYLTLFASYRLYTLVPPGLAFSLLAALAAITALLAVRQDALPLAVIGFGGAFLAPVLASSGQGHPAGLFGYYLLINLAIAWIAGRQSWKLLNLVGFVFTFAIGLAWGVASYTPAQFWSVEPFVVAHFLLYLYVTIQYTRRLATGPAGSGDTTALAAAPASIAARRPALVDGGLLFGVPIVVFGVQAAVIRHLPYGVACSSLALAAIYLVVGQQLWRRAGRRLMLLVEGLFGLGVAFLALVPPLVLDARWTAAAWALQGAGVLWIGLRQQRWWAAGFGLLLQVLAALRFWSDAHRFADAVPLINATLVGALLLGGVAIWSAWRLRRVNEAMPAADDPTSPLPPPLQPPDEPAPGGDGSAPRLPLPASPGTARFAGLLPIASHAMLALGVLQTYAGLRVEAAALAPARLDDAWLSSMLLAACAALAFAGAGRLGWPALRVAARLLLPAALLISAGAVIDAVGAPVGERYLHGAGLVEALLLLALGLVFDRRLQARAGTAITAPAPTERLAALQGHGVVRGIEKCLLGWYALGQGAAFAHALMLTLVPRHLAWTAAAIIVLPTLLTGWLARRAATRRPPVDGHGAAVVAGLLRPWALLLALWSLLVNLFSDGSMAPLPYLPLLNPIDLAHALVLAYLLRLQHSAPLPAPARAPVLAAAAVVGFWWANAVLVRSLHHWAGTPMWIDGALDADAVQTGLTVLWTVCALVVMLLGSRRALRPVWMAGAALLAVVVAKLFFVDLANVGALARIVSFIAVGLLMLVIGYLSPMPPARKAPLVS